MKIKKGVLVQKMGDAFVAYDNDKSALHELNEVGFLILSGIEARKSKNRIVREIIDSYRVSDEKAKRDFEEFLEVLKKKDLIVDKR